MGYTFYYTVDFDSLVHHGTKGMHWGERHYQNKDGTWTAEGKARRRTQSRKLKSTKQLMKDYPSFQKENPNEWATWDLPVTHPNYNKQIDSYTRLQKDIINKSLDWYRSKPVSDAAKKLYEPYYKREHAFQKFVDDYTNKNPRPYNGESDTRELKSLNPVTRFKARKRINQGREQNEAYQQKMNKAFDDFKKQYNKKNPNSNPPRYDAILGTVLNDLGYENTVAGRNYIYYAVIWD